MWPPTHAAGEVAKKAEATKEDKYSDLLYSHDFPQVTVEFCLFLQYWLGVLMVENGSKCPVCSVDTDAFGDHASAAEEMEASFTALTF